MVLDPVSNLARVAAAVSDPLLLKAISVLVHERFFAAWLAPVRHVAARRVSFISGFSVCNHG